MTKFELTHKQEQKLQEWKSKKNRNIDCGAIGGRYTYSFTPTGLGIITTVEDSIEKNRIDLTDYENW